MKNKLKKLLCIFISSVLFIIPTVCFAESGSTLNDDMLGFISSKNCQVIGDATPLYTVDEEVIAYYHALQPKGYLICDVSGNIIEGSFENNINLPEQMIYYLGPMNLCVKNLDSFEDIKSGNLYEASVVEESSELFADKINSVASVDRSIGLNARSVNPRSVAYNTVNGTLRTYDYNPTGICGSTAAAILLMYYDDYVDGGMVSSSYTSSTGQSLIRLLVPHIETDGEGNGSETADVVSGLNWYLSWVGKSSSYTARSYVWVDYDDYMDLIDDDTPAIIGLYSHPTYGNHWVVGYGYEKYIRQDRSYCYYILNDGWGSNAVFILSDYVDDAIYIN